MVSTPNRLTFSPGMHAQLNPFHTKEFIAADLCDLLTRAGFAIESVAGLRLPVVQHGRRDVDESLDLVIVTRPV